MLRSIPIERPDTDDDAALNPRSVIRKRDTADEFVVAFELDDSGATEDLQSRAARIVRPLIMRSTARRVFDVLRFRVMITRLLLEVLFWAGLVFGSLLTRIICRIRAARLPEL